MWSSVNNFNSTDYFHFIIPFAMSRLLTLTLFGLSLALNAFSQNDLPLQTASYLGGAGNDEAHGVGIQSTDHIVIAGKIDDTGQNYSLTPHNLALGSAATGGKGVILRLSPDGQTLLSIARMTQNGAVEDMALHPTNDKIAVIGPSGFGLMSAAGDAMLWSQNGGSTTTTPIYSSGRRVDIGSDGTVAALYNTGANAQIHIYDELGNPISGGVLNVLDTDIGGGTYNERYEDIAVDAANQLVIITGMAQRCTNYQTSFVMAYSYATATFGTQVWKSYTWWCSAASAHASADTRGIRVSMGENGDLLFTGYAHGGNNFLRYVANSNTLPPVAEPNLEDIDMYTNFSGGQVSGYSSAFVARMNPADGSVIKSQFHHNRNNSSQKTTFRATAVAGDASGNVIFGGTGAAHFINRTSLTVNGAATGAYTGGEGYFVELASDFTSRNQLGCLTETSNTAASEIVALAARGTRRVAVCTTNGRLFTSNPIQNTVTSGWGGDTDIYFAFWGGTASPPPCTHVTNTNDSGPGSLRAAVACAASGDIITFAPSLAGQTILLTSGHIQVLRNMTIDAVDAPNLTVSGNNMSRIFHQGWEFDSGVGANVPSVVTYRNMRFTDGFADGADYQIDGSGGAIFVLGVGNTTTIEDCTFDNNETEGWGGGAVYFANATTATVTNCLFENNITNPDNDLFDQDKGEKGGTLVSVGDGNLSVSNCEFRNNLAVNGAGIIGGDCNLLVEDCIFDNNNTVTLTRPYADHPLEALPDLRVFGMGAAIYTDGANRNELTKFQTVRRCTFTNNLSLGNGGAIYMYGYDGDVLTVEDCSFIGNEVESESFSIFNSSMGGGMRIGGGGIGSRTGPLPPIEVAVRRCTFSDNTSQNSGGGLWVQVNDPNNTTGGTVEIENCTIENNRAYYGDHTTSTNLSTVGTPRGNGGGLSIALGNGSTATLNNLTVANNLASWQGGGINLGSTTAPFVTINNTISAYNEAENGGNAWNIKHNINLEAGTGNNNIQSNELLTNPSFLDLLTSTTTVTDPLLDPLSTNGGATETMALQAGSPAIDAGGAGCLPTDQRGAARVGTCDIGAFEFGSTVSGCGTDAIAPTFTFCPTSQSYTDGIDNTISGTALDAIATDNCMLSSLTNDFTGTATLNGATFPVGTTSVIWTATDAASNTQTCSFDVVVTPNPCAPDVTPPTLTFCPTNQSFTDGIDNTILGTGLDATATDNCTLSSLTNDFNSSASLNGATFPVGTTTVIWTATDAMGNTATCSFDVVVAPSTPACPMTAWQSSYDFANVTPFPVTVPTHIGSTTVVGTGTPGSVTRAAIQAALDNGGLITFNTGGLPVTVPIDQTLVVKKHGTVIDGGCLVTLDGQNARRIIYSVHAYNPLNPNSASHELTWSVQNLAFQNGATNGGTLSGHDEPIPNGASPNDGSGNGSQQGSGGAIWSGLSNQLYVVNCRFLNNETLHTTANIELGGGAIFARGSSSSNKNSALTVVDSYFEGNKGGIGGAINNLLTNLTVVRSAFVNNYGGNHGGAIYTDGGTFAFEPTSATNSLIRIHGSVFKNNTGTNEGGAAYLFAYEEPITVTETYFEGNLCEKRPSGTWSGGGGLALGNGMPMRIERTAFVANQAITAGGLSVMTNNKVGMFARVENCTFFDNLAQDGTNVGSGLGGGLSTLEGDVWVINNTFAQNTAGRAGALYQNSAVTMHFQNNIVSENTSTNPFNQDFTTTMSNTITDLGGNIQWVTAAGASVAEQNAISGVPHQDPLLATTLDYTQGFTPVLPLLTGSPAIGIGLTANSAPTVDQIGQSRGGAPDAGAYQFSSTPSPCASDATDPVITFCPTNQSFTDGIDNTISGTGLDATATDNCTLSSLTNDLNSGTSLNGVTFSVGTTTVIWTATDAAGNTQTCVFDVVVAPNPCTPDVTPPTLSFCPANQSLTENVDNTISGAGLDATAADNCTLSSLTNDFNGGTTLNGATFPVGTTTVAWTALDAAGNTMTCSFDVVVAPDCSADITPPNYTYCPSDTVLTLGFNSTVAGTWLDATATDNCTLTAVLNSETGSASLDGHSFPVGTTSVLWRAIDAAGNIQTCSYDVTVTTCATDTITPTFDVCPRDTVLTDGINSNISGTWLDATASDNCGLTSFINDYTGTASLDGVSFPLGSYAITWIAEDGSGNQSACVVEVNVIDCSSGDVLEPNLTCPPNANFTENVNNTVSGTALDASATDNCTLSSLTNDFNGGASLNGEIFPASTTTVTWTAIDAAGNTTTCTFEVIVAPDPCNTDVVPPTLTCPPNANFTENVDNTVSGTVLDASATDNCTLSSLTNDFNGGASLNGEIFPASTTTVTWTAIDAAGNTTTCTFDVIVAPDPCTTDAVPPTFTTCPTNITLTDGLDNTISGTGLDAVATDDCNLASLTNDFNSGATLDGETFALGTTTVTWTATDDLGNAATCSFDVEVIPNVAPTLNNFGVTTTLDNPFTFSASHFSNNFTDPNGDALAELEIISLPTNGTLTLGGAPVSVGDVILATNLRSLMYTPNAGYLGTDSFQWNAQDGLLYAATAATATITIYEPASGGGGAVLPVLNPPTNLVAIAQNTTTIELTWRDYSNGEDGYEVYRQAPSGTFVLVTTLPENATSYSDTGLASDTEYSYYVVVILGTQSAQSNTAPEFTYPEVPTIQAATACSDSSATLLAQGTHQTGIYNWYSGSVSTIVLDTDSLFQTPPLTRNDTFYVSAQGQKYESQGRATASITLLPSPNVSILDSNYRQTCDSSLLLVAEGAQIVSWQWFKDGQVLQGDTSAQLTATASGRYSVWGTDGQCAAQSNEVELVLHPKPNAQILGASQSEYCGIAALQASIEQNISYRWLDSTGNELSQSPSFLAQQSGVYFLEATSPEGCTAYDTAQIQIYDPSVFITFPDTLFRCAADTFTAFAPQGNGFRFAWESPTGQRYVGDTLQLIPASAPEGNYLLYITDTARGCTVADTFFLRVSPAFEFTVALTDPTCVSYQDGSVQFETTQGLRAWLDGQELQPEDSLGQLFRKDSLRAGVYLLELENSDSCHYAEEVILEDPLPMEVMAEPTESIITSQEQAQLQARGAYTYRWYPAAGLSDPNSNSPTAQPDSTTTYTVIGENEVGCTDTAQVTVFVVGLEDLLPSKVISPNGDNINDTWEILNLEKFPGLRVRVFNRWGQEVFASDNYDNTWDGRAPNGEVLSVGAYYFILTLPDGSSRQGHVNVVY